MTKGLAWMVGLSTVVALILASVAGVWLTNDLRVVGLVIVGITPIAAGLVGYFEWRANLLRKALAEQQRDRRVPSGGIMLDIQTSTEIPRAAQALRSPADVGQSDVRQNRLAAEHALDQVLAESFPASDPPA